MKTTKALLLLASFALCSSPSMAAFELDLTGNDAFDGQNPLLIPIADLDTGNSTTASLIPTGGAFNSNAGDFGIVDDQIDGTSEVVTITFTDAIFFDFIDFGGVGSDASDGVSLTVGSTAIDLFTGVSGFNGSTDVYTPASSIELSAGDSIVITGSSITSSFDLQSIGLTVVPEPSAYALIAGCLGLTFVMSKRRRA